jgi:leucyl-tRNA synthetase
MTLRNELTAVTRDGSVSMGVWDEAINTMLLLLAPIAPHVTEELWHRRGRQTSIHVQPWPEADASVAANQVVTMVIQVNGKVRDRVDVPVDISEEAAQSLAFGSERIKALIEGATVHKVIVRAPNLVNVVAS